MAGAVMDTDSFVQLFVDCWKHDSGVSPMHILIHEKQYRTILFLKRARIRRMNWRRMKIALARAGL